MAYKDDIIELLKKDTTVIKRYKRNNKYQYTVIDGESKEPGGGTVNNQYVTHKQLKDMNYVTKDELTEILDKRFTEFEVKLEDKLKPLYKALNVEWV